MSKTVVASVPRHGALALFGYGIQVRVDRGHLVLDDGIGAQRRHFRLPRVGHGLRRLVVIGADGFVSLAALRWLADQDAAFVMLERDGKVLAVTGPVHPSDSRLRRAQAMAHETGVALTIAKELISRKLSGQEQVIRESMKDIATANLIAQFRERLQSGEDLDTVRQLESQAAAAYWSSWKALPILFPTKDKVPDHWRVFGTRKSPLTGSPRLAVNPPGAVLNYCYALLESETRLAAAALGLDPGIGVLHSDTPRRDSLACDIMEAVRASSVDAWVLNWILREPFRRSDFFEMPNGNCRLMGPFAAKLSQTAESWRHAVSPVVEWVARTIVKTTLRPSSQRGIATPLTQRHRTEGRENKFIPSTKPALEPEKICRSCGVLLKAGRNHCVDCARPISREVLRQGMKLGQIATHSPEAEALREKTQRRQAAARRTWEESGKAELLSEEVYLREIQPRLTSLTNSDIASALRVSKPYAAEIRKGRRRPHPRHWRPLAELAGLLPA